jgi:hypothetical protein
MKHSPCWVSLLSHELQNELSNAHAAQLQDGKFAV